MSAQNDSALPALPMASPVPVASPVVPRKRPTKKPTVAVVEAEVPVEAPVEAPSFLEEADVEVMIKQSEYQSLLARVEALESKKKNEVERVLRKSAVRIPTKDVILKNILLNGEKVYSKELINDGEMKGQYRLFVATFYESHNGFLIDDYDNESVWTAKRMYAMSPTTLCSRFRHIMKEDGQCGRGASTSCGFAKCYVERNGEKLKLNTLW